ncbi:MAG: hypothetical protein QM725_08560 [Lacibacter sp.]
MTYLLFVIYLVFFCWLATRIRFFKDTGLSNKWLISLFLLKVIAGIAYGWFFTTIPDYKTTADTWKFFLDAESDTQLLTRNPVRFFVSFFENPEDKGYKHLFSSTNSYWNDLRHLYMVKIVAIFNALSGSRYYVNVIFFSFLTMFGPIAFIRVMNDIFPNRLTLLTISTFLFPSFLFWSSGIHKDGIVFTLLSLIIFIMHFSLRDKRFGIKQVLLIALLILLIFPVRNHVVLAAVPGLFAWWMAEKYFKRKWIAFLLVTIISTAIFFGGKYIHPKFNLPVSIVLRNKEFIKLGGNSFLPQRKLESTFTGFVKNAPQALNHTLARPYITEIASPFYLFCALEILMMWILAGICFFYYNDNPYRHSAVLFLLLISAVLLLLIGLIVPQLGAIVRYRAIFIPYILVPVVATIKWKKQIIK